MHDTSLLAHELLCLHLKCFYGVHSLTHPLQKLQPGAR
jgi:hypothetical protein